MLNRPDSRPLRELIVIGKVFDFSLLVTFYQKVDLLDSLALHV